MNKSKRQRISTEDIKLTNDLGSSKIESLPDELLLNIFSYFNIKELFKCGHVNKKFRQISYDESFWIQVNLCDQKVPCEFIDQILRHGTEYLNLYGAILIGNAGELPKNQLKYLNLAKCSADDDFLVRLLRSCENLQKVSLPELKVKCWKSFEKIFYGEGSKWWYGSECDNSSYGNKCGHDYNIPKTRMLWYIESFLPHSQSLTTLDLRKCLLNFESIKKIILNCVELREANFSKVLSRQLAGITEEETTFFVNNLTPKIEKLNLESADLKSKDLITLVTRCNKITELDIVLNPIDANDIMYSDQWPRGIQISLAAIAENLSESLTKIQTPWQICPEPEFINKMPKLKYVWCHPEKDPRNFVKRGLKPPTMFGQPIGDKDWIREECPQVYINEDFSQIASCTNEPRQQFWDVECTAIELFPEKSQSSQRDDKRD